VRTSACVLDEKEFPFGSGLPWSAEKSNENAETAAIEGSANNAAGGNVLDDAEPFLGADPIGLAGERGEETGHVDTVFAVEVGGNHGAVEGRKAEFVEKMELDGSQVAVGEKRFGVLANEFEIEAGEKVVRAVAAANGGDERGVGIRESAVKIFNAMAGGSGEEQGSALEGVRSETRLEAEIAEMIKSLLDAILIGIGGGREHRDACAGRDSSGSKKGDGLIHAGHPPDGLRPVRRGQGQASPRTMRLAGPVR
jgi:hypothetical protein